MNELDKNTLINQNAWDLVKILCSKPDVKIEISSDGAKQITDFVKAIISNCADQ